MSDPRQALEQVVFGLESSAAFVAFVLVAVACNHDDGSNAGASTSSIGSTAGTTSTSTVEPSTVTMNSSGSTTFGSTEAPNDTSTFVTNDDVGSATACDLFAQDCDEGFKCVPCATHRQEWDSWRCAPVSPNGSSVGESCSVSGCNDDCDQNSVCHFAVPANAGDGVCVGMCTETPERPQCIDRDATCLLQADGIDAECSLPCDPLAPSCPENTTCHFFRIAFTCRPSEAQGAYGDACTIDALDCDEGLACVSGDAIPDCGGSFCCTTLCDLSDPMASAGCPDLIAGQACVQFEPNGEPVPGADDVGSCAL